MLGRIKNVSFSIMIGVSETADANQVRKQARKLLRMLHPDHGGSTCLFAWLKEDYDAYHANWTRRNSPSSS